MIDKNKVLTFSYDDGVTQDVRLIQLFNQYGMKATFNLNSGLFGQPNTLYRNGKSVNQCRITAEDIRYVYEGHEVAAHTITHPNLTVERDEEIIRQVEVDRLSLSEFCGYEVLGMVYSCGGTNYDARVSRIIRENTGIQYARTAELACNFDVQKDLYEFKPSMYHRKMDELFALGEQFLKLKADSLQVFYFWGHIPMSLTCMIIGTALKRFCR